ncbi:ImmA/IrrE family metallo-endopeptidase, partial [Streptomyces sp. NPDC056454]
ISRRSGISEDELARRLLLSPSDLRLLLNGEIPIDETIGERISREIGASSSFWVKRYKKYRDSLNLAAEKLNREFKLPLDEMRRLGWIPKGSAGIKAELSAASFLEVRSIDEFESKYGRLEEALAFRRSTTFDMEMGAVTAWYRAIELASQKITLKSFDAETLSNALGDVRRFTLNPDPQDFLPEIVKILADCGVALCVVPAPLGCPVSGIACFNARGGLIGLSSRYLTDDQFWFSLFHEVAHLCMHAGRISIEVDGGVGSNEEDEANEFASKNLVPEKWNEELNFVALNKFGIARLARKIGVSPGIVVGQLQHRKRIRHNQFNYLKNRYKWSGSSLGKA